MKFTIEKWNVKKLLEVLEAGKLNLNPPYQRNPIWTKKTQKFLIKSIKDGSPIPNIFLYQNSPDSYEIVDGQQRTRAFKSYWTTDEIDLTKDDSEFKNGLFLSYEIPVTIITKIENEEHIEDFYHMVNSSGVKLNRPETFKAQYFDTKFLKLVELLTIDSFFESLSVVPVSSQKRMMDRDLIEELCALILHGITDKKNQVDKLYESDITAEEAAMCKSKFDEIIKHLLRFDKIQNIKSTRYRQRNDFYTLFGFLKDNLNIEPAILDYFYEILLQLEKGIRPSKTSCRPLADYAFDCVSQSNSAKARQNRLKILSELLLNQVDTPNTSQDDVKMYYGIEGDYLVTKGKFSTFDVAILKKYIDKKVIEEQGLIER